MGKLPDDGSGRGGVEYSQVVGRVAPSTRPNHRTPMGRCSVNDHTDSAESERPPSLAFHTSLGIERVPTPKRKPGRRRGYRPQRDGLTRDDVITAYAKTCREYHQNGGDATQPQVASCFADGGISERTLRRLCPEVGKTSWYRLNSSERGYGPVQEAPRL